jgi:hypothetical protein
MFIENRSNLIYFATSRPILRYTSSMFKEELTMRPISAIAETSAACR